MCVYVSVCVYVCIHRYIACIYMCVHLSHEARKQIMRGEKDLLREWDNIYIRKQKRRDYLREGRVISQKGQGE